MTRRLMQAAGVLLVVLLAAQLVRPARANPPTDPGRTIHAYAGAGLGAILDRSCGDCHSNQTVWPWYTSVAPLSWLMARGVAEGRRAVNFSEWGGYSPAQRRILLAASCDDVKSGKMPGPWTVLHPETKLAPDDIRMICAAAGSER